MRRNRITFEGWAIRLVGRDAEEKRLWTRALLAEEIDEEFGNAGGFFVLEPVGGVGESVEFGGVAIGQAVVGHGREEEGVVFAPENARGDVDGGIGEFCAIAEGGAIPVDHRGERVRLRPGGAVLGEIVR